MFDIQNLFRQKYFYLFLALIPVVIWIAGIVAISSSPYTGLSFVSLNNKWYIGSVDKNSPATKAGDITGKEIVAIGKWHITGYDLAKNPSLIPEREDYLRYRAANDYFIRYLHPGHLASITIVENNSKKQVYFTPVTIPPNVIFSHIFSFVLTAFITLTAGILIIFKRPDDTRARIFFLFTFFVSLYLFVVSIFFAADIPPLSSPLMEILLFIRNIIDYYIAVSAFHFLLIFPRNLRIAENKIFIISLYILPVVLFCLYTFSLVAIPLPFVSMTLFGSIFALLLYRYFLAVSPDERSQIRLILYSFGICCAALVGYAALQSFDQKHYIDGSLVILLVNLIPISMAFAIMRYRIMDIDTLFDNTLIYMTTLGIFAAIDIAFIYILSLNHLTTLNVSDLWWAVAGVWFIIFSYIPVRNTIQLWIKKLLKREIYDTDKVIIEFQKQLLSTDEPDKIKAILLNTIESALHPKKLSFIAIDEKAEKGLSFSLKGLNENIGTLYLSDKHSGNIYTKEDIKLIETLSNMAAIVIESISTREKAILEKQEIAREIHDNIGHSLIMAKYMASETNRGKELENILDNGLSDLREVLSLADGEKQILADFIEQVYKRSEYLKNNAKMQLVIDTKTEDETIDLPYQVRSNLMKIIQEAISNAIKYSAGDSIKILIEQVKNELTISITDNGKGFDTSKDLSTKHHGLRNMSQRAEVIGAGFSITSSIENGTTISVRIKI